MAKIFIGGTEYQVPVLNLKTIKKVWPVVQSAQSSEDMIEAISCAVKVVALALVAAENPKTPDSEVDAKADWIEETMTGTEMTGLRDSMRDILIESGLLSSGEVKGEAAQDQNSTETLTE